MSADFLLKVATAIDEIAAFVDGQESDKQALAQATRDSAVNAFSAKYAEATGDELPEDVRQKLAVSDDNVLNSIEKLLARTGAPESLGGSSEKTGSSVPQTKAERAAAASERFTTFLTT